MAQRILIVAAAVALLGAAAGCKNEAGTTSADGGKQPKLACKMNNQCWICPDDEAMKRCIINPVTSGCKQSGASECEP